ncbi:MAG: restriction endonuclease [Verrucomicrobia bacterium]|nr:MAG: restriction endonuclease [Verrucomicrobiota bacterium]
MAIPKYDEMMLPVLRILGDGAEHSQRELAEQIADHFKLTPQERAERLPKVKATYLRHRLGWAGFSLRRAGLAESPRTGTLQITDEGRTFLASNPSQLRAADLKRFPAYAAFVERMKSEAEIPETKIESAHETPEERIEAAFSDLNQTLVGELLTRLSTVDPFRFERIVLDLLVAMGYGGSFKEAAAVTQKTGDEGIDGVINEDRLGLDVIYIQAKRWKSSIGRPEIQNFVGALAGKKAGKGIFITTSEFHDNARDYAAGIHQKIILIDGRRLAELMIEHDIGVAEEHAYSVKKIDGDYFEES